MGHTKNKNASPQPILFTHYGDNWLRGSEFCLINLLENLNRKKYTPVVWCNSTVLEEALLARGFTVYKSNFTILLGWKSPRLDILSYRQLVKFGSALVRQHNIQLLHSNSGAPTQWLSAVSAKMNIPLVTHLHCRYQLRDRIALGLHLPDRIVGVSRYVLEPLIADDIDEQRLSVIPNGIDTMLLDAQPSTNLRKKLNIDQSSFVIATTGSLIKRKGIDLLIDALPKLIQNNVPAHLLIIGSGEEEAQLRQQIKSLSLEGRVHLIGEQRNVVGILKATANLFISAAREEAFGLVLVEAGLAGLPVIAPNVGGVSSVITHGENGLLIAPEDTNAIHSAIYELYKKPIKRIMLGATGRVTAFNYFDVRKYARRFESLYESVTQEFKQSQRENKQKIAFSPGLKEKFKKLANSYLKDQTETK